MNIEENVPNTIPRIIASEKLRILSPPKNRMTMSTSRVEEPVLIVRARVWLRESLNSVHLSRFM